MRNKEEIMEDVNQARSSIYRDDCILEVLIDIRDILDQLYKTNK